MTASRLFLCLLALLASRSVLADQLVMNNGSLLIGNLISVDGAEVVFNTPFAGDIKIKKDNIKTIVTDSDVTLLMEDGDVFRNKRIVAEGDNMVVLSDRKDPVLFHVEDIQLVNPEPWRLGEGYKWYGDLNTALESERGNTDTDELDLNGESIWRSLEDRYTLRGDWEIDESNGERNKFKWTIRAKYDRFSLADNDNYVGVQAFFNRDEFADLNLRQAYGPYIGRQFYESSLLTLHAEVGVVYVEEDFDVAEDDDYVGSNWEARLTSEILPGLELYVNQDGVYNFREASNLIVNTRVGLRFPLIYGFTTSAEALWEYDGGAVEGVDDTDETYRFTFGYAW
ncbi:MAG: DUF481 domain-containing protein [Pseudomonadota bacterium]